jgi:drug/metabolite transporter (DMT)-like permease
MASGWILQAMALDRASLLVVQSLTALSLVVALPLGALLTDQHIGRRELGGALLTSLGIIFFIAAGQPQGGTSHPSATSWWIASVSIGVLVVVLVGVGARFRGSARALTYGAAAGLGFGLQAAVTKTFVTEVGSGILALLSSWSVWVLILSALTGFALQQAALKTGVLAPAMASANSVTLFTSVVLGITVYGERVSKGGAGHSSSAFLGLIVAILGIALLAGSGAPQPSAPSPSPAT